MEKRNGSSKRPQKQQKREEGQHAAGNTYVEEAKKKPRQLEGIKENEMERCAVPTVVVGVSATKKST